VGFAQNKGQIIDQKGTPNSNVKFLLNSRGLNVQLRKNGFSYDVYENRKVAMTEADLRKRKNLNIDETEKKKLPDYSLETVNHRVDIDFEGSNASVVLEASGKSKDYDNYYTLKHAPDGVLMVHQFEKVTYKNLYPNIDVVFFVPADSTKVVEYNFIVRPGGKVSDIKMRFRGLETELANSKIRMETRFGIMEETLPLSWTEADGVRNEVTVGYKKINKNVYGFDFDESQIEGKTIVIDPVPVRLWGTYYANDATSTTANLITDIANNVYINGSTTSATNVATWGAHQSYFSTAESCFFAKIDADGVRIWGTYYSVQGSSMVIDHDFNLIFVGTLFYDEINIVSAGCHQPVKNALNDMYVVKLNSTGVREWGTYYGESENESAHAVAVDSFNAIYLGGQSASVTTSLTTPGSFQYTSNSAGGIPIGILVKFSPIGERIWGTFYGGTIYNIDVSPDDSLYLSGFVNQNYTSNIATGGAYSSTPNGSSDGYITKFNVSGQRLWGTFLGIAEGDGVYRSRLMGDFLYILGKTSTQTGVATPGTFYPTYADVLAAYTNPGAVNPCYIMKFNLVTKQRIWSTYFLEILTSIDVNSDGEVFAAGYGGISNGIATPDGYMPERGPYFKGYFFKLNTVGQRVWGSYYGGNRAEQFVRARLDHAGDIYLSGTTFGSSTGIATSPGMISSTNPIENYSSFLAKFRDCKSTLVVTSNSPVCPGGDVTLTASGGTNYSWTGPNGFTSSIANPIIPIASAADNGEYFCAISELDGCNDMKSVVVVVGDSTAPVADVATLPTLTGDCNSLIIPVPTATDTCLGSVSATTASPLTYTQVGTYTIVWDYTDGTNTVSQNQTIVISPQPLPVVVGPIVFCKEENATLNAIVVTGQNIEWYDTAMGGALLPDTILLVDGVTYYVSQTINGCESERIAIVVTVQETTAPSGIALQSFCDSQVLTLADFMVTGTDLKFYDALAGGNLLPITTSLVDGMPYYASQTLNGCESITRLALTPNIIGGVPANAYAEMMCDDLGDGLEIVDLLDYKEDLISNSWLYDFSYYNNFAAADAGTIGNAIVAVSNYPLAIGLNTVYVRIVFNNSCYDVVALELTVVALPNLQMKDTYMICENGFVTITANSSFDNYNWSTGELTQSIMVTQAGNYSITVSKNSGNLTCSTTKNFTVEVSERATITAVETVDWTSSSNVITVYVYGSGDYEYSVDGVNFQTSNQFYDLPNGEYTVYVNDIKGCGVAKKDVYLLMYPKYFTPNGDTYNDFWGIQFYQNEINLVVKIFDRYGKFIKQLTANDPVWDGTYNGYELPSTDYWFTVIRQDGTEYKGHFTLKR
jgi:gliding motility-associated-like protein